MLFKEKRTWRGLPSWCILVTLQKARVCNLHYASSYLIIILQIKWHMPEPKIFPSSVALPEAKYHAPSEGSGKCDFICTTYATLLIGELSVAL